MAIWERTRRGLLLPFRFPGLLVLSVAYSGLLYGASWQTGLLDMSSPTWVASVAALLLLSPIYHALVLPGIHAALRMQPAGWRGITQDTLSRFAPLFVGQLVSGVAVLVGALLLVVPGIVIGMRLIYYKQSIVFERRAPSVALRESLAVSRDVRSTVFLFLALVVLYGAAVGLDVLLTLQGPSIAVHVGAVLGTALLILWMNILVTEAYFSRCAARNPVADSPNEPV